MRVHAENMQHTEFNHKRKKKRVNLTILNTEKTWNSYTPTESELVHIKIKKKKKSMKN